MMAWIDSLWTGIDIDSYIAHHELFVLPVGHWDKTERQAYDFHFVVAHSEPTLDLYLIPSPRYERQLFEDSVIGDK